MQGNTGHEQASISNDVCIADMHALQSWIAWKATSGVFAQQTSTIFEPEYTSSLMSIGSCQI